MNDNLNKFRKRNIQANLYQFILVIFVVAVSVCLISGLFISHLTLKSSLNKFYLKSNLPSLWVETDKISLEDENFLSKYEYSKRFVFESDFQVEGETYKSKFLVSNGKVSTPYIVEGDKGFGCYVDSKFIDEYNIGISFTNLTLNYSVNGETKRIAFKVLGSLAMAEDLVNDSECLIFIDEDVFLQTLKIYFNEIDENDYSLIDYNQILITSKVKESDKAEITNYYANSETNLISIKSQDDIDSFVTLKKELKISEFMLWFFPILFVIISILVIISSISQLVLKERYNIGLLKSLGFANNKILSNYSGYGSFVCFFGAILGFIFSPLIIPNITFETYDKLYNLPKDEVTMSVPIILIISVLVIATLIGYFSAYFVCLKFANKSPKECMSGKTKIHLKSKRKSKIIHGIFGGAVNNLKINMSRSIMTAVSLFGCLLLIEIGFAVSSSFKKSGFLSIKAFSGIFKGFSIILLMLTIIIALAQIFKERRQEMAMLRILGESYIKIWLSIVMEILILTIFSFLLSCVLCQPVFLLVQKIFGISGNLHVKLSGIFSSLLITLSIEIIVLFVSLFKVYKINLSESIKFSE